MLKKIISHMLMISGLMISIASYGSNTGTILSLDLAYRTIQIDKNEFILDEHLQIFGKNTAYGNGAIKTGQKVEYWIDNQEKGKKPVINRIRILSKIKDQS